jgi:hypothetical protein
MTAPVPKPLYTPQFFFPCLFSPYRKYFLPDGKRKLVWGGVCVSVCVLVCECVCWCVYFCVQYSEHSAHYSLLNVLITIMQMHDVLVDASLSTTWFTFP